VASKLPLPAPLLLLPKPLTAGVLVDPQAAVATSADTPMYSRPENAKVMGNSVG
jgi:hypothetical protein